MLKIFIPPSTQHCKMILFLYLVVIIANHKFLVNAVAPITIGQKSVIPSNQVGTTPVWQTWPNSSSHPGYEITNIGENAVRVSIYWKDSWPLQTADIFCGTHMNCSFESSTNIWYEFAEPVQIEPNNSAVIKPSSDANFYFTRLVVISDHPTNSSEPVAVVNVTYKDDTANLAGSLEGPMEAARSEVSQTEYVKNVFKYSGSKLPPEITSSGMEALIELFWPKNKMSVWDTIRNQVRTLVDQETYYTINALLGPRMMGIKRKLDQLAREIKENQPDVSSYLMNLARDLIGLEEEAIIRSHSNSKKLNEDLLPVYSNIILMKAAFYSFGIKCQQRVNLRPQNLANLNTYFNDTIRSPNDGANEHISQIFNGQITTPSKYNREAQFREKIQKHGYTLIWNNMLDQPGQKIIIDEMLYSDFQGFFSTDPVFTSDSLPAAGLHEGKYNEIQKLILYQSPSPCPSCCSDTIFGMKIILKNGDSFEFGNRSHTYKVIELNGAYRIREITLRGKTTHLMVNLRISLFKLDKNEWKKSEKDEYVIGCPSDDSFTNVYFSRKNYYIASLNPYFDSPPRQAPTRYPLVNMAVSFLPLKSQLDNPVDESNWKEWTC